MRLAHTTDTEAADETVDVSRSHAVCRPSYDMLIAPGEWHVLMGGALGISALAYSMLACAAMSLSRGAGAGRDRSTADAGRPVTLLKPLCGAEPETYECLKSFCVQSYSRFQIVFGVSDPNDPAIGVVERLKREFPALDLRLVVDRRQHGSSRKVSNLINMMAAVSHDLLILSDSDVRVGPEYVLRIAEPLSRSEVGIVTCAYRGVARPGFWSLLGAMYINEWFIPSVRVAALSGSRQFAFGATIGIRATVLNRIGGFAAIADQLADDYRLGEMTRALGLLTVLSSVEVDTIVIERTFRELAAHELRWLRTIRAVRPIGFALAFLTFSLPMAVVGVWVSKGSALSYAALGLTVVARLTLHRLSGGSRAADQWWALPIRDVLTLGFWAWSFSARSVQWRENRYVIARDGSVLPVLRI